ncbi:MAG: hypothetical protein HGA22_12635 [Clostridiales bacterium]|nr:hypothetical protein [Clostridiales bacterium]
MATGITTYHFEAEKEEGNYIVWAEEGQGEASAADNHMISQVIRGIVEYYTETEFDPAFNLIQLALNSVDVAWNLDLIEKKTGTSYIRYLWTWEMMNDLD